LAPYAPGGGGCQRFAEPVLSPLLYNSNLLVLMKGIFEVQRYRKISIKKQMSTIKVLETGLKGKAELRSERIFKACLNKDFYNSET